jgi:FAD/FMN-containing dehydrogenase
VELSRDIDVRRAHSRDSSGLELIPDEVARASSAAEAVAIIRESIARKSPVTAAGSQTSMTGASITDRGLLLSLAPMNRIIDIDVAGRIARVEPGVRIGDLNRALSEHGLQFAPDPTSENDATIGGAIACNASGARSLHYGATRAHVGGVQVVHADGSVAWYRRSRPEKNAVGYAAAQDPVDWFVGSEGTLGVVTEAELSLVEAPLSPVGLAIPFSSNADALDFVVSARRIPARFARCLEFFDRQAIEISSTKAPPWEAAAGAMIYLEDDAGESGDLDAILDYWLALAESHNALSSDIRVYQGSPALREARVMRHAVPATLNERGAQFRSAGGRKVSTDWAVPFSLLRHALEVSEEAVRKNGAPIPVTYGHAGNGHPHQNFIATNSEDLDRINAAVEETLHRVIELGGTVSAEHGLGKLKSHWLVLQFSPMQMSVMRAIKASLDPEGMFAPGNIL